MNCDREPCSTPMRTAPIAEIVEFFRATAKTVITFGGFGELGYRDPAVIARLIDAELDDHRPDAVLVNCGTLLRVDGNAGISQVFATAKERGFETSGIHPGVALDHSDTHRPSPFEDHAFFVDDDSWGGLLSDGTPSPTLAAIVEISEQLVMIGGGQHAADELRLFLRSGKVVRYLPAEMDREFTEQWCARSGVEIDDLRGAAHRVWMEHNEQSGRPAAPHPQSHSGPQDHGAAAMIDDGAETHPHGQADPDSGDAE